MQSLILYYITVLKNNLLNTYYQTCTHSLLHIVQTEYELAYSAAGHIKHKQKPVIWCNNDVNL